MITVNKANPTPGETTSTLVEASDSGHGLHFDGAAGNIDIASPPDVGSKFSFEFILQQDSNDSYYLVDFDGAGSSRFIIGRYLNNLQIYSSASWYSFSVAPLDDNEVHHIVVTVDGTAAKLYDNGNEVGAATISSAHAIDSATDAGIGSRYSADSNFFNGTIYRARIWNKTLTAAEVTTSYENATVPFADQWGSQTTISSGTTTSGLRYRITARDGVDFTTIGAADNNVGTEFVATGSVTLDANDTVIRIGVVSDYDLAFANPTQSRTIQDRSTNNVKGTASTSGVTQVTPIEQLNTKALSVGTSAVTPADGQIIAGNGLRINAGTLQLDDIAESIDFLQSGAINFDSDGDQTGRVLVIGSNRAGGTSGGTTHLTIDETGNVNIGGGTATFAAGGGLRVEVDTFANVRVCETGNTGVDFSQDSSANGYLYNRDDADLIFGTNNTERIRIDAGGNVGFSTSSPNIGSAHASNTVVTLKGKAAAYGGIIDLANHGTTGNGQTLGAISVFDNTTKNAEIEIVRESAADDAKIVFKTKPTGGSIASRLTIESSGVCQFKNGLSFDQTNTSATGAAATSSVLSHYETGTWTAVPQGGTSAGTYTSVYSSNYYTRIGRQVTVHWNIAWSGHTGSGDLQLTGLPFASGTSGIGTFQCNSGLSWTAGYLPASYVSGSTITFRNTDDGGSTYQMLQIAATGSYLRGTLTYFI